MLAELTAMVRVVHGHKTVKAIRIVVLVLAAACQPILGITNTELTGPNPATDAGSICGDGLIVTPEQCDDGNSNSADGCSADCRWETIRIVAGGQQSCAVGANGVAKCWGDNSFGELGLGDTRSRGIRSTDMGDALPSVWIERDRQVRDLVQGHRHACAVLDDGVVRCWGANFSGIRNAEVFLDFGQPPLAITAGAFHTCVVFVDGVLVCWGYNGYGQLGVGDGRDRDPFTGADASDMNAVEFGQSTQATAVAAGGNHTCAIVTGGAVRCWGKNDVGQLGLGNMDNRGEQPDDMNPSVSTVDLGNGRRATSLAAGDAHTCAILESGAVKCWGYNAAGQLGLGDFRNRGGASGQMGDLLPEVDLGGVPAVALALGDLHTCVLLADGRVDCWGGNADGQLGRGDSQTRATPGVIAGQSLAVDLGSGQRVRSIRAGTRHNCSLLESGAVKCWGYNAAGQLGIGSQLARGDQPGQMGDLLPPIDLSY